MLYGRQTEECDHLLKSTTLHSAFHLPPLSCPVTAPGGHSPHSSQNYPLKTYLRCSIFLELSNGFPLFIKSWFLTVFYKDLHGLASRQFLDILFLVSPLFTTLQFSPVISCHLEVPCHRSFHGFPFLFILTLIQILFLSLFISIES